MDDMDTMDDMDAGRELRVESRKSPLVAAVLLQATLF